MILSDLHVHTSYCDGNNTPEEVVKAAIDKGMTELGIVTHAYVPFDKDSCIPLEKIEPYKAEINHLKQKYADKIKIHLGAELDYYSEMPTEGFDYTIGSVHYIRIDGQYVMVDYKPEMLIIAAERYFGGDIYELAEGYFALVGDVINKTHASIIGHFDLFSKFNENYKMFDETNERYVSAWKRAVDRLIPYDVPFEINTGAISRGYRTTPYPRQEMLDYIYSKGGKTVLSSDSHSANTLCYQFDKWDKLLK